MKSTGCSSPSALRRRRRRPGCSSLAPCRAKHRLSLAAFDIFSHNGKASFPRFVGEFVMRQKIPIIAVLTAGFVSQLTLAQEPKQQANQGETRSIIGTIERLDPRFDKLIPKDAQLE